LLTSKCLNSFVYVFDRTIISLVTCENCTNTPFSGLMCSLYLQNVCRIPWFEVFCVLNY